MPRRPLVLCERSAAGGSEQALDYTGLVNMSTALLSEKQTLSPRMKPDVACLDPAAVVFSGQ